MMFLFGMVIGFAIGVVLVTLAYAPLTDRIVTLERLVYKNKELRIQKENAQCHPHTNSEPVGLSGHKDRKHQWTNL